VGKARKVCVRPALRPGILLDSLSLTVSLSVRERRHHGMSPAWLLYTAGCDQHNQIWRVICASIGSVNHR